MLATTAASSLPFFTGLFFTVIFQNMFFVIWIKRFLEFLKDNLFIC